MTNLLNATGENLRTLVDEYERQLILSALAASGGQQNRAAARLGVLATTLHAKIRRLGIQQPGSEIPRAAAQTVTLGERLQEFRWGGQLRRGAVLKITGMRGAVSVSTAEGEEVEVVAVRSGRSAAGQAEVSVLEHDGGATVAAHEAGSRTGRPSGSSSALRVDFHVWVPEGVSLVVRILSGDIAIHGVTGQVDAHTMSGQIKFIAAPAIEPTESRKAQLMRSAEVSVKPTEDLAVLSHYQPNGVQNIAQA